MSPLMRERIAQFKSNKLGFSCFIIFLVIFVFSLCAELIANDKPLLVKYDQSYYFPAFKQYLFSR